MKMEAETPSRPGVSNILTSKCLQTQLSRDACGLQVPKLDTPDPTQRGKKRRYLEDHGHYEAEDSSAM